MFWAALVIPLVLVSLISCPLYAEETDEEFRRRLQEAEDVALERWRDGGSEDSDRLHREYLEVLRRNEEAIQERARIIVEKRLERVDTVEIPSDLGSSLAVLRYGIDDLGMTVRQVIQRVYLSPHLNKDKLCYWESVWFSPENTHNLACQFKGLIRITFILSRDKSYSLIRFHSIDHDRPLSTFQMAALLF